VPSTTPTPSGRESASNAKSRGYRTRGDVRLCRGLTLAEKYRFVKAPGRLCRKYPYRAHEASAGAGVRVTIESTRGPDILHLGEVGHIDCVQTAFLRRTYRPESLVCRHTRKRLFQRNAGPWPSSTKSSSAFHARVSARLKNSPMRRGAAQPRLGLAEPSRDLVGRLPADIDGSRRCPLEDQQVFDAIWPGAATHWDSGGRRFR